jgi:hypothetical protein
MNQPQRLPPGAADQLDTPEGTLMVVYVLPRPLEVPPDSRISLVADQTKAGTTVRFDIDEQLRLHFVRQAPGGQPADVDVGISPLRGASRLRMFGMWSPTEMVVHVLDADQPNKQVRRSTGP